MVAVTPKIVLKNNLIGTHYKVDHLSQNISIAARSILEEPEVMWGMDDGLIYDLVFDNVVIGDEKIETLDQFYHNEYVLPLIIP